MAMLLAGCDADSGDHEARATITDLMGRGLNDSTIALTWTAPSDEQGRSVEKYDLRYAKRAEDLSAQGRYTGWPLFAPPAQQGDLDSTIVTLLDRNATYFFTIRGISADGDTGDASNISSAATFPDTTPPAQITDLKIVSRTGSTLSVEWTAVGDDGVIGRARSYDLRYAAESTAAFKYQTAMRAPNDEAPRRSGVTETKTISGLNPKTGYTVAVVAVDDVQGRSPLSNPDYGVTDRLPQDWQVEVDGSGDAPTIQAAIDSSRVGETIWIGPGTYFETIQIVDHPETIRSVDGPESTILDGGQTLASSVEIRSVEGGDVIVCGLTITGGLGSPIQPNDTDRSGGGVFAQDANVQICHCIVRRNGTAGDGSQMAKTGGGIYCERRYRAEVPECRILQCVIDSNVSSFNGGGIAVGRGAHPVIRSTQVKGNVTLSGDGGGIWLLQYLGTAEVSDCNVVANFANDHGGGIYLSGGDRGRSAIITNNLVEGNIARQMVSIVTPEVGAGIWCNAIDGLIDQNTIVNNAGPDDGSMRGGGISISNATSMTVSRNIVAFNGSQGGIACFSNGLTVQNNLFWENDGGHLMNCATNIDGKGNSAADPDFCNPSLGMWTLKEGSPALTHVAGRIGADTGIGCAHTEELSDKNIPVGGSGADSRSR